VKPRLVCLLQLPPPVHGTTVINAQVAASKRIAERFDVDVVPLRFADTIDDVARPSLRKLGRAITAAVTLGRTLARSRASAVYFTPAGAGGAFYRDLVFVAIMRAFGVPRIYHLHGKGIAQQLVPRWRRALYRWSFDDAYVIQLSPLLAADVAGLVPDDHLAFVPNGIADEAPVRAPERSTATPRVLFLSSLAEAKGPLVLLDALGLLARRGVAFEATFAGAPERECLRVFTERLNELRLGDRVRYIGPVYGADKHAVFDDHDVFAFPTCHEAFGLVLLEAMQHRLPVVATREGAIPDIVIDGETGVLVPTRDAAALADGLERLISNPELRRDMGLRGRARFEAAFTASRFETTLAETLDQLVARARV
jgi:glycosyltransferase involved in cell wall biosynthesis